MLGFLGFLLCFTSVHMFDICVSNDKAGVQPSHALAPDKGDILCNKKKLWSCCKYRRSLKMTFHFLCLGLSTKPVFPCLRQFKPLSICTSKQLPKSSGCVLVISWRCVSCPLLKPWRPNCPVCPTQLPRTTRPCCARWAS